MRDDCIRIFCISFCANLRIGTKLLVLGRDIEKRIRISGRQQFFPMPVCEMGEELVFLRQCNRRFID